jgi:hypothetical protein
MKKLEGLFADLAEAVRAKRLAGMAIEKAEHPDACWYCGRPILPHDDAQQIEQGVRAHSACAWAIDEAFWAEVDK